MPDASYDAVVIGGGHNGLCTAAYLARTGLKVGVFERRHEEGGGAHTEEATVPGFWHNLHAQYMEFIDYMPFFHDFNLPAFGARVIKPADESRSETPAVIAGKLFELWMELGFKPGEFQKSPKVLIDDLFESTELRAALYRQCIEWGSNLHSGNGFGFVVSVIWLCGIHYMSVGGTHTLGHAMAGACLHNGVDLRYNSHVAGILTKNDRATGVRLR